ncbi:MAG: peptide deformylase [Patescibacteria group bacterium]|nr:peptide deformylase [Patescibacteria group bacterium]
MPKLLNIIIHPNDKILRKVSVAVDRNKINFEEFKVLCKDMTLTMEKKDGVGLAAPQIGKNIRLIVVASKDGPICMINPVLKNKSLFKEWGVEGCLSVPNKTGEVKRHRKLVCDFIDIDSNKKTIKAKGLMARIFQHEVDHLNGVLFIDKARNIKDLRIF